MNESLFIEGIPYPDSLPLSLLTDALREEGGECERRSTGLVGEGDATADTLYHNAIQKSTLIHHVRVHASMTGDVLHISHQGGGGPRNTLRLNPKP